MVVVSVRRYGKAAASLFRKSLPSQHQTNQYARTAGLFTKHVVGAAVKPMHILLHQGIGFIFIVFAVLGAWRLFSQPGKLEPPQFFLALVFIMVLGGYGLSSILKSRRIAKNMRG